MLNVILWDTLNCDMIVIRYNNNTHKLMCITDVYGLQRLITEPTRITSTFAALSDEVFTICPDKFVCSGVLQLSISDHTLVFGYRKLSINGTSSGHNVIIYRNFRKFNRENFHDDVASQNWDPVHCSTTPNEMWSQWKRLFLSTIGPLKPILHFHSDRPLHQINKVPLLFSNLRSHQPS